MNVNILCNQTEPNIYLVQDKRYRHAIPPLRCSSHILHIDRERYKRPRTPLHGRLCYLCNCVEDELHFVTACSLNFTERTVLYDKVAGKFPTLTYWMILESSYSYSHSKMIKCSLGLRTFCTNHSQSKHPNEMVTLYDVGLSQIYTKTEERCSWRPQGHDRCCGLSGWQPPTPLVTAVAVPHPTISFRNNYRGII